MLEESVQNRQAILEIPRDSSMHNESLFCFELTTWHFEPYENDHLFHKRNVESFCLLEVHLKRLRFGNLGLNQDQVTIKHGIRPRVNSTQTGCVQGGIRH